MEVDEENLQEEEKPMTFADFGFIPEIMQGLNEAGFTEPTPIQRKAIPVVLEGRDLIGQALTGTGKTAAFGLPVMNKIAGGSGLRFLVLVPTRELAAQVSAELYRLGRFTGMHTAAFTGGQSYSKQEKMLSLGIDMLVATPGRLIDLIDSGHFANVNPEYIVVDEADEMLDMGFIEDIKKIFASFEGPRQTMLFSATMPRPVVELAETILNDPVEITTADRETTNNDIEQFFFVIEDHERTDAIIRLIDAQDVGKAMIFCRTKEETDALNILLGGRGYNVNCLHGDMEQAQRTRVMAAFRRGEIDILVATDVAARGLDVDDVTHVFNFHLPFDSRGYVHRIGRTGRAGKTGTAITLVTPRELRQLEYIRKNVGAQIENRLIPTRTEVTSLRLKKIFHDIHDIELDMDILNQIQTLTVNQDVMVLLAKLAKRLLSGGADQGPEHIGIEGQRLTNLLSPKPRERNGRGRGGRGERGERGEREERPRRERRERKPREEREERAPFVEGEERPKRERRERKPRMDREQFAPVDAQEIVVPSDDFAPSNDFQKREEAVPREERRERKERSERKERKPRRERDEFSPREERSERKERGERKPRKPRRERDEFSPREERSERKERGERKPRRERDDFSPREERKERGERKPRRERDEFSPREERKERRSKESKRFSGAKKEREFNRHDKKQAPVSKKPVSNKGWYL